MLLLAHGAFKTALFMVVGIVDRVNGDGPRTQESPSTCDRTRVVPDQVKHLGQHGHGGRQRRAQTDERIGAAFVPVIFPVEKR